MRVIVAGGLVALAALVGTAGTAEAKTYAPDAVVVIAPDGEKSTYQQMVQLYFDDVDQIRQEGGCGTIFDPGNNTATVGWTFPLGRQAIISACNAGVAGR